MATAAGVLVAALATSRDRDVFVASTQLLVEDVRARLAALDASEAAMVRKVEQHRRATIIRSLPVADRAYQDEVSRREGRTTSSVSESAQELAAESPSVFGSAGLAESVIDGRSNDQAYLRTLMAYRAPVQVSGEFENSTLVISVTSVDPKEAASRANAFARAYQATALEEKIAPLKNVLSVLAPAVSLSRQYLARAEAEQKRFMDANGIPLTYIKPVTLRTVASRGGWADAMAGEMRDGSAGDEDSPARRDQESRQRRLVVRDCLQLLEELGDLEKDVAQDPSSVGVRLIRTADLQVKLRMVGGSGAGPTLDSGSARAETELGLHRKAPANVWDEEGIDPSLRLEVRTGAALRVRVLRIADALYSRLVSEHKEIILKIALAVPDVRQIDPAVPPESAVGPTRTNSLVKGGGAGFIAAFLVMMLFQALDPRLKGRTAIARSTRLPIMGIVPDDPDLFRAGSLPSILSQEFTHGPLAEAIKEVRTVLKFDQVASSARKYLITSCHPGDGKTTLSTNLAISLTQLGERVLLVDSDLRNPHVHSVLGLDNRIGLSQILENRDINDLIRRHGASDLRVLTAGPPLANPLEFLCSAEFQRLVTELGNRFDRIIFDSPPVQLVGDSAVISQVADCIILVVKDGSVTGSVLRDTVDKLGRTGTRMCGIAINRLRRSGGPYGYHGYSSYPYGRHGNCPAGPRSHTA